LIEDATSTDARRENEENYEITLRALRRPTRPAWRICWAYPGKAGPRFLPARSWTSGGGQADRAKGFVGPAPTNSGRVRLAGPEKPYVQRWLQVRRLYSEAPGSRAGRLWRAHADDETRWPSLFNFPCAGRRQTRGELSGPCRRRDERLCGRTSLRRSLRHDQVETRRIRHPSQRPRSVVSVCFLREFGERPLQGDNFGAPPGGYQDTD